MNSAKNIIGFLRYTRLKNLIKTEIFRLFVDFWKNGQEKVK